MNSFLFALQFLTIIPVKIRRVAEKKIARAMVYFPLVGLLLGLGLSGVNNLLLFLDFEQTAINVILVVLPIILTGGLHLDGLADTADALSSRKNKEEMLAIMRDSHIGVMGVLSLISIILLKIAFLSSIASALKTISLVLMCVLSRWSMAFAIFAFSYAREEGKAKGFMEGKSLKIFTLSTITALACIFVIWKFKGLFIFSIIAMSAYITGKFINNKIGGITGDTLGAINELTEVMVLLSICLTERGFLCSI